MTMSSEALASRENSRPSCLVRKLSRITSLSTATLAGLDRLLNRRIAVERGTELIVQGQPYRQLAVVVSGSAMRYRVLRDGRRQITNFIVPGDFVGMRGLLFPRADNTTAALEDCEIAPVTTDEFYELWRDYPFVQAALFWSGSIEESILNERIVALGRRTAYERLAYVFLELMERLELVGLAEEKGFNFPLTQGLLADALGLTPVHISRSLKRLRKDGLVTFAQQRVIIHEIERMKLVADYEDGYLSRCHPSGLPLSSVPMRPVA